MTVGFSEQVRPVLGMIDVESVTGPAKPFRGVIVIILVPVTPELTLTLVGFAEIVKS